MSHRRWLLYDARMGLGRYSVPLLLLLLAFFVFALSILWFKASRPLKPNELTRLSALSDAVRESSKRYTSASGDVVDAARKVAAAPLPAHNTKPLADATNHLVAVQQQLLRAELEDRITREQLLRESESLRKRIGSPTFADRSISGFITPLTPFLWPSVAVLLFSYLMFSSSAPQRIEALFRKFTTVKLFSAEFVLNSTEKERAADAVDRYRAEVKSNFDEWIRNERIDERLKEVMDSHVKSFLASIGKPDVAFRATIHVPDLLFQDSLYQLVDYYASGESTQNPRGRIKSIRFGFIGKVWRSKKGHVRGRVPANEDLLVQDWGMTLAEAKEAGKARHSFAGFLVYDHYQRPIAIIYLDSLQDDAFWKATDDLEILEKIAAGCEVSGLSRALARMHYAFERTSPLVTLYK